MSKHTPIPDMIHPVPTGWEDVILICKKCSKKLSGGFGEGQDEPLRKALRGALKAVGKRGRVGMIEVSCFGVCPKKAVTVTLGSAPGSCLLCRLGSMCGRWRGGLKGKTGRMFFSEEKNQKTFMSEEEEIARRRRAVREGRTDRERWTDPASYEAFWSRRAEAAGGLALKGEWVCDIGCGALQSLKAMLPEGAVYLPADLQRWTPEVMGCDLNAEVLPKAYLRRCSVVYLLGVIEYVNDLPSLFDRLAGRVESVVVSYNCLDFADVDRAGFGWVNALTSQEFMSLLAQCGFDVAASQRVGEMEILVRAHNRRFGWRQRLARAVSRRWGAL